MDKLFTPLQAGKLLLKNRIVMPPMGTGFGNVDGTPSEITENYYRRRAEGGAGLIIVELAAVDPMGRSRAQTLTIYEDRVIDSYRRLSEEIKQCGACAAIQLNHAGRLAYPDVIKARPVCPSPSPVTPKSEPPRELSKPEIKNLVEAYVRAAGRAKAGGFDGVEIHGAHGYFIWQFLSPLCNKREDEYGGSTERRVKFAEEIVRGIKQEYGKEITLSFRMSGSDFVEGGLTLEETKVMARILEMAGVDVLHVSGGSFEVPHWMIQPMTMPQGCLAQLAEGIRKAVHIPVIAVGRINDPQVAGTILQEGKADLVAMGRGLIADPDLPKKAMEGHSEEIRKCVADNTCMHQRFKGFPLACMVNPEVGREKEFIKYTGRSRKVLVIGGGPAGLEAARSAKLRGHDVTLWEKKDGIGGQLSLASRAPYKKEIENVLSYYQSQVGKIGIKVELNKVASLDEVKKFGPDAIIIGTGSSPFVPDLPGIDQSNVVQARDVLGDKAKISGKAVIIGGGHVGCETAEYLWGQGVSLSILEMLDDILLDMEPIGRPIVKKKIIDHGTKIILKGKAVKIEKNKVIYTDQDGAESSIDADFFILATGAVSENQLLKLMERESFDVHAVGDCAKPRDIYNATWEGATAALRI